MTAVIAPGVILVVLTLAAIGWVFYGRNHEDRS